MEIKAYALIKNDMMIGKFFDTKRSVEETYAEKLEDKQYSIGVFTFSGETEIIKEEEMIELYTSKGGYMQWKKGYSFGCDDVKDRWNEEYREGDYIFKVKKEHIRSNFWGGFMVEDAGNVDIMKPYKEPKPVVEEEKDDLEVDSKKSDSNEQPQPQKTDDNELRATLRNYVDAIQTLPDLRILERVRRAEPRLVAEQMTVTQADSEGIVASAQPRQYVPRESYTWLDCFLGTDSEMPETKVSEEDKMQPIKLTQEDLDCPF
ncbi:hypothetical protein [Bacillus phage vB_BanS-Thrax5]|nr:hypothetical protein [Bacillus phage vB_BanS-Thrax5]